MKVKEGYRQTEIGVIPVDWQLVTFKEVFTFLTTATYSRSDLSQNEDVQYVHYGDIHTKWNYFLDFDAANLPTINNVKAKNYPFIKEGDIIMADASEDYEGVGKSVVATNVGTNKAITGLHTFLLRDKNKIIVNGLKGYIHANPLVKQQFDKLATGLKVFGVSKTNLKLIQIPIPSTIEEQTTIAKTINDTEDLIRVLEKLIFKKKSIKNGTLELLLTGKKRLSGYTSKWVRNSLKQLCYFINDGTHHTPKYVTDGIPFYSVENVIADDFINTKFISPKEHNQLIKRCKPEKGDILLTRIGAIGATKLIDWNVQASIYVSLALLKVNKLIDNQYLYWFTKTSVFVKELEKCALMNAIPPKINMGDIGKVIIDYPPTKEEQQAIAIILYDMQNEIEHLEKKLHKYKMMKQGMMQNILTGKIRLA